MSVRLDHVSKRIRGRAVLDDVTLDIPSASIAAFTGPNGSGKTMLLRAIAGLLLPTEGKVIVDGTELGADLEFPSSVGLLIEYPVFLSHLTGLKNLELLASIKRVASHDDIAETLENVGLDPFDKRKVRSYSLGMRQRLGIAAAVMERPKLLLIDEPTNALDVQGVEMVKEVFAEARRSGSTVIFASHDREIVSQLADVVFELYDGALVKEGSA